MSDKSEQKPDSPPESDEWFLKKNDGNEYGPETLETMVQWASESRIISGNALSNDRKTWIPVEQIPELAMQWVAELPDGRRYGPFNILATRDLLSHKVLPPKARLLNRETGKATTVKAYCETGIVDLDAPAGDEEQEAVAGGGEPEAKQPQKKGARRKPSKGKNMAPQNDLFNETAAPLSAMNVAVVADSADENERPGEDAAAVLETETVDDAPVAPAAPEEDEPQAEEPLAPEVGRDADNTVPNPAAAELEVMAPSPPASPDADTGIITPAAVVEELRRSLDELEQAKAVQGKELAALKRQIRKLEGDRDAAQVKLAEAEAIITEKTEALGNRVAETEADFAAAEARHARDLSARDAQVHDLSQKLAEAESRLTAAHEEARKAHKGAEAVKATLEETEKKLARRVAIEDQKLKEVLRERNTLATLVEAETSRILRLKMGLVLLAVAVVALGVTLLAGRSCRRAEKSIPGVAELPGRTGSKVSPSPLPPSGPPIIEGIDGIRVLYSRSGGRILFDEGVFTSFLTVSPRVSPILARLGPHLKRYMKDYSIVVVGHTDDQPPGARSGYRTNDELALARAREFARIISRECGIPLSAMRAVSARDEEPPYPNTDAASRARNRTVVIKLVSHASE